MASAPPIHVVAGILRDPNGRVLVAQRPAGKHLAGFWEFPGGKSDPGESPLDALRRELAEEIGIRVEGAEPLISVPWTYPEKRIVLDAWIVERYGGEARAREGQALRWVDPGALSQLPMPPADVPIVTALTLPYRYAITPVLDVDESRALLSGIERLCASGVRLIQLRQPTWPGHAIEAVAVDAHAICARHGAELLLNADWRLAERVGLDGVHLPARVAAGLDARPVSEDAWLAVSCHDRAELAHAERIGADFATLAPIASTPGHPDAETLGWARFASLVHDAALPIYALGGLGLGELQTARRHGAQGIAAIRAFWP